jgi:tetratricopeptide (TPR) repeat protein
LLYWLLLLLFWIPFEQPQPSSLLKQGLLALQSGDLKRAQTLLESAGKAEPQNPFVWASLAETYLRLGDPKQALASADKAEKLGSQNPTLAHALALFYSNAAMLFVRSEDFSQAAALAENGLRHQPRDPQLHLTLGVARYGQRRFDDAISCFLRVIDIDPDIEQPYIFLGKMLDQAGSHLPEITSDLEAWLRRAPENPQAPLVLAKALQQQDPRSARAEELLRHSIQLDPANWESHYQLGVLLENRRQYREAAGHFEQSIALDPQKPMPHYHLARVYDRLGEPERAKSERQIHERLSAGKPPDNSAAPSSNRDTP